VSLFQRPASVSSRKYTQELIATTQRLMRAKQYPEALPPLLRLHQAYPRNHVYLSQLATAYEQLQRPREEAETWEQFVQISPTPVEACPRIGFAYREQGRVAESI